MGARDASNRRRIGGHRWDFTRTRDHVMRQWQLLHSRRSVKHYIIRRYNYNYFFFLNFSFCLGGLLIPEDAQAIQTVVPGVKLYHGFLDEHFMPKGKG